MKLRRLAMDSPLAEPRTARTEKGWSPEAPEIAFGVWRRRCVSIAGGAPVEAQTVVWLQTRRYFADLRLPLPGFAKRLPPAAFSGRALWRLPKVVFERDMDSAPVAVADAALLRFEGNGQRTQLGGRSLSYTEAWAREPLGLGDSCVLEATGRRHARLLVLADHALLLVAGNGGCVTRATHFRRTPIGWRSGGALGRRLPPPPPNPLVLAAPQIADAHRFWTGRRWTQRDGA